MTGQFTGPLIDVFFSILFLIALAIGLQIMELIADKKGIDKTIFDSIKSDLDEMKRKLCERGRGTATIRPPSTSSHDRDFKKQRT